MRIAVYTLLLVLGFPLAHANEKGPRKFVRRPVVSYEKAEAAAVRNEANCKFVQETLTGKIKEKGKTFSDRYFYSCNRIEGLDPGQVILQYYVACQSAAAYWLEVERIKTKARELGAICAEGNVTAMASTPLMTEIERHADVLVKSQATADLNKVWQTLWDLHVAAKRKRSGEGPLTSQNCIWETRSRSEHPEQYFHSLANDIEIIITGGSESAAEDSGNAVKKLNLMIRK